jgi:hypothetical protein
MHRLDVEVDAAADQFGPGDFLRGQQGGLAADFADQRRAGTATHAEGGQFRIPTAAALAAAAARARRRPVVPRGDEQQQAAQQANLERPALGSPQWPVGLGNYFFLAASTAGEALA